MDRGDAPAFFKMFGLTALFPKSKIFGKYQLKYLDENQRLWKLRNKPGGYERSIQPLNNLINQIDNRLSVLGKPWSVWLTDGFFNKLKTAGIVMLLNAM